ncbi:WD40 repeat domain-containing protein [Trichocoleus desertorum AS-A10]|uniref:WD40 repeat domain-containing protein n=1 Tax=Trichocoleus desertorum TaxID=1481672 RepID=UPI0032981ACD
MPFQLRYTLKTLKFWERIGLYPDGTAIVAVEKGGIIGTWEVGTGKLIQTLEFRDDPKEIRISQDGQTAIVRYGKIGSLFYDANDRVTIWDIPSQQMLGEIQCGYCQFDDQSLSADRHTIVGRHVYREQVMVWHLPTGQAFCTFDMPAQITCVAINSTGQIVVAGNETDKGGAFKVWDLVSNAELHSRSVIHYIPSPINPYSDSSGEEPKGVADIWLSADAKLLLCKIRRDKTQIWDLQRGQRLNTLPPGMPVIPNFTIGGDFSYGRDHRRMAISQDGGLLATTSEDGSLVLRNLKTNEIFSPFAGHTGDIQALVLSPDGKTFITYSIDNTAKIWDLASGELLHSLTVQFHRCFYYGMTLALTPAIVGLPLTLFVIENGGIGIWDVASRRKIQSLKHGRFSSYRCSAISADGQWLASGGGHGIYIWNWQQGKLLHSFVHDPKIGKGSDVLNLVFSSRYECLISTAESGSIRFWNWLTGEPLSSPLLPASAQATCIALSPDERLLAAVYWRKITIWNLETGEMRHTLPDYSDHPCTAIAFSPDGRLLATGYLQTFCVRIDHDIKLWDVATGQVLQQLKGHTRTVTGLVFSPDGQLISCSEDASIRVWQLASD